MDEFDESTDTRRTRTEPRTNGSGGRSTRMETPMSSATHSRRMPSSGLRFQPRVDHLPPTSRMTSTSSDTKAKGSSRSSGKKLVPILSPEGRLSIETLQKQEAELLRFRTMGRIGELYMAWSKLITHYNLIWMKSNMVMVKILRTTVIVTMARKRITTSETQEQHDKDFFKVEL
jgi:hypothetical protein